jgi:peptidyl-prolyl cis-trans isomerase B (cyclophilin B)
MADHKDATDVTIATTEPQSEFSTWVQRLWMPCLGLFIAVGGYIAVAEYQAEAAEDRQTASWVALSNTVQVDNPASFSTTDASAIASVAVSEEPYAAGPWAKYIEASVRDQAGDAEGALGALEELQQSHPNHMLNSMSFAAGEDKETVTQRMRSNVQQRADWEANHPKLFANEDLAENATTVKFTTTEGVMTVGLYTEQAPLHCANFLKLCSEGFYDGTKFHRVIPNFMIQGGDPNSKDVDVSTWGSGGPGYKVDREENDLKHFVGYLAAAKMGGEVQSSGSQFYITTGSAHHLDGQHGVCGKLIGGMETVRIVESSLVAPGTTRPETPATITSTEVL